MIHVVRNRGSVPITTGLYVCFGIDSKEPTCGLYRGPGPTARVRVFSISAAAAEAAN